MWFIFATALGLAGASGATPGTGTIPEPDLILYGQVCLPTGAATDSADVTVIARTTIDGQPRDVGRYKMGDEPSASDCHGQADCYVLRIRVETVPVGESPSGTAVVLSPSAPSTVSLYVKPGAAAEVLVATLPVADRGVIRRMDLRTDPISADVNGDGLRNLADYAMLRAAITGPAVNITAVCDRADINRDGHVDLADVSYFQNAFLGS